MRKSTLLLLLVFVALAALSALLRPGVGTDRTIIRLQQAREELDDIHGAVRAYLRGRESDPELPTLETVGSPGLPKRDPWGTPYEIRPGSGSWAVEVISCGPDGLPGTEDDLSSITRR